MRSPQSSTSKLEERSSGKDHEPSRMQKFQLNMDFMYLALSLNQIGNSSMSISESDHVGRFFIVDRDQRETCLGIRGMHHVSCKI